jgi:hypothetical protein
LLRKRSNLGWVLIIGGPLALAILVPAFFLDRVTVNPERFRLVTGFWFAPTVHDVRFDDLSAIEVIGEERHTRSGTRMSYYLLCHRKTGGAEKVPVGDLMKQGATDRILQVARGKGIHVANQTDLPTQ